MTDPNRQHRYVDAGDIDLDEEVVLDSHGRRITEAVAREWAEEVHQQVRARRAVEATSSPGPHTADGGRNSGGSPRSAHS